MRRLRSLSAVAAAACFSQVVMALTEDNQLRVSEVASVLRLVSPDIQPQRLAADLLRDAPNTARSLLLNWADKVLVS